MTRVAGTPAGSHAAATVCTACPLLCDDVATSLPAACAPGAAAFAAARARAAGPAAWLDGVPCARDAALERAAAALAAARRVLVTGLAGATLEGIAAACDLAETLGAAVDPLESGMTAAAGPTIARVGSITAEWEELRDRADLVILWFCDPATTHPRFIERFVTPPLPSGRVRRTIAIGSADILSGYAGGAAETARRVLLRLSGHADASHTDAVDALHAAIDAAECVAIVTGATGDAVGLDTWSVAGLVRHLAHRKPAFQVPLGAGVGGGGANVAGAAAVCTWRYGAAGAIVRADRGGSLSLPGEADAVRLIARGEVDCVLAIGPLDTPVEEALATSSGLTAPSGLTVIRVDDAAEPRSGGSRRIQLRAASLLVAPAGTMLRGDGRWAPLVPDADTATPPAENPDSLPALMADLHARVRAAGGRS